MKLIKNLVAALLLASVLSVNVFAGDQSAPGGICTNSCPPATTSTEDAYKTEETQVPETPEPSLTDQLWAEALTALLSLY